MKKDLSSTSQQEEEEEDDEEPGSSKLHHYYQSIPDGLRLRNRNIERVESNQKLVRKDNKMKQGLLSTSKSHNSATSSGSSSFLNVDEYFNDVEEEDLVIIDSDEGEYGTRSKRKKKIEGKKVEIEHVTKFARSEKSELIEFIYGTGNEKVGSKGSKFGYHNESFQDEESDEDMDETSSLNPIIPHQKLLKVQTKQPNKVSAYFYIYVCANHDNLKERRVPELSDDGERCWFKADDSDFEDIDDPSEHESSFAICIQVFIPFLIAGFGTVGAGLVLDVVQVNFSYCV